MKYCIKIILISFLFLTVFTAKVFAAEVFVSTPQNTTVGKTFDVSINANTDEVLINSANIILNYDEDLLTFSGYKSDGSMVNLWLHSPYAKNGSVYMDGIIPGGVSGLYNPKKQGLSPIPLVILKFTAKKTGTAQFSFTKTEILKHDGKGTPLIHDENWGEIVIKENLQDDTTTNQDVLDTIKPEQFIVTFLDSSSFSKTPAMIIFNASDAGSGIKEYQMNKGGSMWTVVQSPYQVSKSLLSYTIVIRAFDFSGNYQESSIIIPGFIPTKILWPLIILLLFFCILGYRVIKYRG